MMILEHNFRKVVGFEIQLQVLMSGFSTNRLCNLPTKGKANPYSERRHACLHVVHCSLTQHLETKYAHKSVILGMLVNLEMVPPTQPFYISWNLHFGWRSQEHTNSNCKFITGILPQIKNFHKKSSSTPSYNPYITSKPPRSG